MPRFHVGHHNRIANVLQKLINETESLEEFNIISKGVYMLANMFEEDNTNFNRTDFLTESGVEEDPQEHTLVDVVASGYEWICPVCEVYHREIEHNERLVCTECDEVFEANPPEHVYG